MEVRETHLICLKCGHVVILTNPKYQCSCGKCVAMRQGLAEEFLRQTTGVVQRILIRLAWNTQRHHSVLDSPDC